MHDKKQPYELDIAWCINQCHAKKIRTTENMLEAFADKVADLMAIGESEENARDMAFSLLDAGDLWVMT